eukprot:m.164647 g.164647  ORF g.164647 m.164647 type:complete len:50 (+) comp14405_c0_seq1:212-361(+)
MLRSCFGWSRELGSRKKRLENGYAAWRLANSFSDKMWESDFGFTTSTLF